jgi:hypothetical protein
LGLIKSGVIIVDTVNKILPRIFLEPLGEIRGGTTKMDVNIGGE